MPLQQTSGAASYDAFGGGVPVAAKYIEDFFQTWLRTGTGASATVTTGLNGAINEAMVWTKSRSAATDHKLTDNVRGATKALSSNTTDAEVTDSQGLTAFSSTGYTIGTNTDYNNSGATYVDWQWVATPKFFDVVTWTGDGTYGRQITHGLGSVPGCIIVKRTDSTSNWGVYHQSLGSSVALQLNTTAASAAFGYFSADPTASGFFVTNTMNANGGTYVAYLFAHNAGGFGLTGTDNVISCGSFTTDGSGKATVNLGYEPQWVLFKNANSAESWTILDTMRGFNSNQSNLLWPDLSDAEVNAGANVATPTATGFQSLGGQFGSGSTVIYIAIRRGPMKVPTDGTKVFSPVIGNNVSTVGNSAFTTNFVVDSILRDQRSSGANAWMNRLTGATYLRTSTTNAEGADTNILFDAMNGVNSNVVYNWSGNVGWNFQRAPGFFDVVCYTGTGSNQTLSHNLTVAPTLMIIKRRDTTGDWWVIDVTGSQQLNLNQNYAASTLTSALVPSAPTTTTFSVGTYSQVNGSGNTFVAYLFATCPGVSKVGSYTGNGTTQAIACGFTGGARFVLIKRTDDTGDWYVYDTARGMTVLTDPYLLLNSTAAETATLGSVITSTGGFTVNAAILAAVNTSGANYIFLAIA